MKMYIFRKDGRDFERIKIEVDMIRKRSVIIRHKGQIMTLEWDSEYTFEQLKIDDILNIYILGEDYSKGYVLPHLRDLSIKDLDIKTVVLSQLEKIKQSTIEEKDTAMQLLRGIVLFYTGKNMEDLNFLKDIVSLTGANDQNEFKKLKEAVKEFSKQE